MTEEGCEAAPRQSASSTGLIRRSSKQVTTKPEVNPSSSTEGTGQWDWSDVTGPPRGDPTLHLTFISSQITWVWLSLGFAQRGARESSTATLTCIVGVSLGFGEGHVRPVVWDKCSHTWCQTWERSVSGAKHTPICRPDKETYLTIGSGAVRGGCFTLCFVHKMTSLRSPKPGRNLHF